MDSITPAHRAALQQLVAAMADPAHWVTVSILRDAVGYSAYRAIMALPPPLLERLEEYETWGKVVAVRPTAEALRLVTGAAPDA